MEFIKAFLWFIAIMTVIGWVQKLSGCEMNRQTGTSHQNCYIEWDGRSNRTVCE